MKYVQTVVSAGMFLALSLVQGQTPPASPIFDVRYESRRAIQVAPGQVITVNLSGFEAKKTDSTFFRVKAPLGNGTTPLEGFSSRVEVLSSRPELTSRSSIPAPILMVEQQDNCHLIRLERTACWVTSLTIQIPWELSAWNFESAGEVNLATLHITDGTAGAQSAVQPQASKIHLLARCDATLRLYDEQPSDICAPDVRGADGLPLSTAVKPGDVVTIRAYGLGGFSALEAEGLTGTAPPEAVAVPKNRYSVEYRWGHKGLSDAADEKFEPESVELAAGQVGLYLVKVRVPSAPQNLAACEGRTGTNLSLSLRGYQSTDTRANLRSALTPLGS